MKTDLDLARQLFLKHALLSLDKQSFYTNRDVAQQALDAATDWSEALAEFNKPKVEVKTDV